MCQDLSKANKQLKKEVTLLRFKVTRLTNKMENNQKQWVETLQEIQQESHQDALEQDCGKCFDIGVCVWGGGAVIQWEAPLKRNSWQKLQQRGYTSIQKCKT